MGKPTPQRGMTKSHGIAKVHGMTKAHGMTRPRPSLVLTGAMRRRG